MTDKLHLRVNIISTNNACIYIYIGFQVIIIFLNNCITKAIEN